MWWTLPFTHGRTIQKRKSSTYKSGWRHKKIEKVPNMLLLLFIQGQRLNWSTLEHMGKTDKNGSKSWFKWPGSAKKNKLNSLVQLKRNNLFHCCMHHTQYPCVGILFMLLLKKPELHFKPEFWHLTPFSTIESYKEIVVLLHKKLGLHTVEYMYIHDP